MRILKYFRHHIGAIVLVVLLLIAQAYCDLSLPNYTSDIVDVGIQQNGIEHPALSEMRAETYENLGMLITTDTDGVYAASYDKGADGNYYLNSYGDKHIDELDSLESLPMVVLSQSSEVGTGTMARIRQAVAAGAISTEQIDQFKQSVTDKLGDLGGTIVKQKAILFASSEYDALGLDGGQRQISYLFQEGLKMLGVTLGMVCASILVGLIAARTAASIARDLRREVFEKVISFSHKEFDRFSTASLITRSTNDIQQIQMVCVMLMRMILYAPILGIGGVLMISHTNVSMSWIIGLAILVIVGIVITLFSVTMPKFKIMQKLIDKLNLVAREMLNGIPVIRAFARERHEEDRFEDASRDLMRTQLFTNRAMTFMMPLMMVVMNGVSVLIVWTAANQINIGAMQVGDMIAFITYSMMIIFSFLMLCLVAIMLPRAAVAAERVDAVRGTSSSILDPDVPVDLSDIEEAAGDSAGTVAFDHVSFRYENAEKDVLHDITFTAYPGKTTAIIGTTGCGKSTLLNLIPRFYDVTQGSLSIDGADIRTMSQSDLRSMLGYAPQKGVLFSGTIADNIKFGGDDISDEKMRQSAEIAQASEFIESKDAGYDEYISQGGTNVSGGQKQRLSIARALATGAQILLFDDSFSALDYKTDAKLRRALGKEIANATVIIVAQRISTVLHADQIVVLDEGRIVGKGTHGELMDDCETYREIASSQLSSLELEGGV